MQSVGRYTYLISLKFPLGLNYSLWSILDQKSSLMGKIGGCRILVEIGARYRERPDPELGVDSMG